MSDDQDGAAEFLKEKISGLDVGVERGGSFTIGLWFRLETAVGGLVGEGHVNAAPGIVGSDKIVSNDGSYHGTATAALGPGFNPRFVRTIITGEACRVRHVART